MPLAAETRLGLYEITSSLGSGGVGEVCRARDTKFHRDVAIRVLSELMARDRERVARRARGADPRIPEPRQHRADTWRGGIDRIARATSDASIVRGIEIATKANYLYAVGVGERIAGRLARYRGDRDRSRAAFERALTVFHSIGATFEAECTRREVDGASA